MIKALANESRLKIVRSHGIVNGRSDGNVVYDTLITLYALTFFTCPTQVMKELA